MTACPRCGTENSGERLELCPNCLLRGEAEPDADEIEIPGLVLTRELGQGGMGRVFLAHHRRLGRDVAVKLLSPELARDLEFRARFEREARTLAQLDHPGIVRIHDFGATADGDLYLVLELVAAGSLRSRLPLAIERALELGRDVCGALEHAHARGVVHRDIKPENVLIGPDGRAKLGDFGIAALVFGLSDARLTRPSRVLGTPVYMAPEARAGAPPDPKVDVYAVGLLLHEMLAGALPHEGSLPPPAPIAALIRRATAVDPRERPSAGALARELEALLRVRASSGFTPGEELPPEERSSAGAVALLLSVASAVAIYAFVISISPRVIAAGDALPLVTFGAERLPDGQVLTRARFEVWPVLGAAFACAMALLAYGALRGHWRRAGLETKEPDRPLAGTRRVVVICGVLLALFALGELLRASSTTPLVNYIPVLGGVLELGMLWCFWSAVLESRRTHRSLRREPWLWLGFGLSLMPPASHLLQHLAG